LRRSVTAMGIYDRDYYREGPSYLESLIPSGLICKWLICLNIVIFLAQLVTHQDNWITNLFILDTDKVLSGQVWRLLTYAFLHSPDAWTHIIFNMIFLWWFGSDVESLYGPREFLTFYLCSAFFGGVAYETWAFAAGEYSRCLGASGAVTALLVLCACHFPHRVVYVMLMVPVPLWLFAVFNVVQDLVVFGGQFRTGVAVVVHLAGALFAFTYYRFQIRLLDLFSGWWSAGWWSRLKRRRTRPRLRLFRPEDAESADERVTVPAAGDSAPVDEHLEAKLDAVLEKLARTGKESLTEGEREILLRASEIYKRRRT
jgi:membrane associated rhomboid family serine protease